MLENVWSEISVFPFTKKILMNKKVCHDVIMGYKGDALNSQLKANTIWDRQAATTVAVPQTCKRQDAIAAANTSMSPKSNIFKAA
jgi:hypothetical protein